MSRPKKKQHTWKSRPSDYLNSFNFLGIIVGALFIYAGFLPSLLPRGWILQGVVSGVVFSIGYGIGLTLSHFIRKFNPQEPTSQKKHQVKQYAYYALGGLYIVALVLGFQWQQEIRTLIGQSTDYSISILGTTLVALLIAMLLIWFSRATRSLYGWLKRIISKYVPKAIAYTAAWAISALLVVGLINGVLLSSLTEAVNQSFSIRNGTTDDGITKPTSPLLSGSDQSLIAWDTLGRQGRTFVGNASTVKELSEFNQKPATQPIRTYSGLESASSAQERADLAVDDLKRAGGFDREIIVVATTTGTGWVDEDGVTPIEYMYNGDSAIVSMQYSYLPSWLSFLVDQTKAKDAGNELYNAVYNEVLELPAEQRPKIVAFGESLGSFGGESAFSSLASFKATSDGAVWVGPPNFNILRKTATENRDPNSPEILPIFQQGKNVRFAARPSDLKSPEKPWETPRAVYLQNPSDPIVWWSPSLMYQKPDWLSEPRGADVSPRTHWIPIVTFLTVSGDMVFSTDAPDGHGHKYGKLPTDAWSYVAPPEGWTKTKTESLKAELSK